MFCDTICKRRVYCSGCNERMCNHLNVFDEKTKIRKDLCEVKEKYFVTKKGILCKKCFGKNWNEGKI